MDLVGQVMAAGATSTRRRVFVIVDNGSDHRGQAAINRLANAHPNAIMIHTPVHASWLNQIEIFFSVIQKKVVTPNDFASLEELSRTLLAFVDRYNQTARPFNWKFTASDLPDLMDRISRHEQQATLRTNRYRKPHDNPRRTYGTTHLSGRSQGAGLAPSPISSASRGTQPGSSDALGIPEPPGRLLAG